ncbi:hypothetical protein JCM10914A_51000 [Paenibacillus sp. JCM 10914]
MSTNIFLVRHAIKEKRKGDVSITAEGIIQAQATAGYFSKLMIDAIIAVQRAKITDYIAQATNAPVTVDDRLRERRLGGSA